MVTVLFAMAFWLLFNVNLIILIDFILYVNLISYQKLASLDNRSTYQRQTECLRLYAFVKKLECSIQLFAYPLVEPILSVLG